MQQGKAAPTAVMNLVNEEPHRDGMCFRIVRLCILSGDSGELFEEDDLPLHKLPSRECEPNGESCPSSLVPCSLLWFDFDDLFYDFYADQEARSYSKSKMCQMTWVLCNLHPNDHNLL